MSVVTGQMLLIEMPGGGEMIIILIVVLLLFGGKKIPELMRGLGRGVREFNDAKTNVTRELEEGMKETPRSQNSNTASSTPNANSAASSANNTTAASSSNTVTNND